MVQFIDLPDVVLLMILSKLPMWKILQLARLCHRLNHLKLAYFNANFKHLRLLFGPFVCKLFFDHVMADLFNLKDGHGDFDLIIQFANQQEIRDTNDTLIILSEDLSIHTVDQIDALARMLPQVTHLTLVVQFDMPPWFHRLFSCWPKLKSLKLLNRYPLNAPIQDGLHVINSLDHLEHLQLDLLSLRFDNAAEIFAPLFRRGKLKTFIGPQIALNAPNETIQALERGLQTFGMSNYNIDSDPQQQSTSRALNHKLKCFQGELSFHDKVSWNLNDWTTLQCVYLRVNLTDSLTNSSLKHLLAHLSVLTNLTELHLDLIPFLLKKHMSPESFQNLPRLESVRQFQIKCILEPHECLHLLASAFPNASELSHVMVTRSDVSDNDGEKCIKTVNPFDRVDLNKRCVDCKQSMKRAIVKYGHTIARFYWFLEQQEMLDQQQNQPGEQQPDPTSRPSYKLIPKVRLCAKEIGGRMRPNFGVIPID